MPDRIVLTRPHFVRVQPQLQLQLQCQSRYYSKPNARHRNNNSTGLKPRGQIRPQTCCRFSWLSKSRKLHLIAGLTVKAAAWTRTTRCSCSSQVATPLYARWLATNHRCFLPSCYLLPNAGAHILPSRLSRLVASQLTSPGLRQRQRFTRKLSRAMIGPEWAQERQIQSSKLVTTLAT